MTDSPFWASDTTAGVPSRVAELLDPLLSDHLLPAVERSDASSHSLGVVVDKSKGVLVTSALAR